MDGMFVALTKNSPLIRQLRCHLLPTRGEGKKFQNTKKPPIRRPGAFKINNVKEKSIVLGRPGSDLLSHALRHSTIGAKAFNDRVRDGIGFWALRNNHQIGEEQLR